MAISLNSVNSTLSNHGSRITALEGKVGAGGGITESSFTNPGYVKFANGLIINFGGTGAYSVTYKKAFTRTTLAIETTMNYNGAKDIVQECVGGYSNTGFHFGATPGYLSWYIAIGYLITNRLLNYIHEKLNSFKNLKGVMNGKTWRSFYNLMADSNVGDKGDSSVSKFAVNNGGVLEWQ